MNFNKWNMEQIWMNESAAEGKTYSFFDNLRGVVYHDGESL